MTKTRPLFLGRFQPVHVGHIHAIEQTLSSSPEVLVGIGSAQHAYEADNPFTCAERLVMLRLSLPTTAARRVHFVPLSDVHDHSSWVAHVQGQTVPFASVVTGNPVAKRLFEAAGVPVHAPGLFRGQEARGRLIRARMASGKSLHGLVHPRVDDYLKRIHGAQRIRSVTDA